MIQEQLKSYPSIKVFRNLVYDLKSNIDYRGRDENEQPIYVHDKPYPIVNFKGTAKAHGINCSIVEQFNGENILFKTKSMILDDETDKAIGFKRFMTAQFDNNELQSFVTSIVKKIPKQYWKLDKTDIVEIFGEFCGTGVQKDVAISKLPKMFIIFDVRVNDQFLTYDELSIDMQLNERGIYNIKQFGEFNLQIDFELPEPARLRIEELVNQIEHQCPIAKHFGITGDAEGIVWTSELVTIDDVDRTYKMKTKCRKFERQSEIVIRKDTSSFERHDEFANLVVHEARLEQWFVHMLHHQIPQDMQHIKDFIRLVQVDVIAEESDTMTELNLTTVSTNSSVANIARAWYIQKIK